MEYKGKVYAKINGKYIECTETVQQLEDKISKLESALENQEIINEEKDNDVLADIIRCPKCGGENEYSQGFKQNIQPVDGGDWRQICFNICDRCGYAIDVWFWD